MSLHDSAFGIHYDKMNYLPDVTFTDSSATSQKQGLDEVSRIRYELESSRLSVEELQDAITIERQQCLSWMEKHNKVIYYLKTINAALTRNKNYAGLIALHPAC